MFCIYPRFYLVYVLDFAFALFKFVEYCVTSVSAINTNLNIDLHTSA